MKKQKQKNRKIQTKIELENSINEEDKIYGKKMKK